MNIVEFISCLQARAAALEALWSLLSMSTVDEAEHAHVGHTKVPLQVGDLGQYLIHGSVGYRVLMPLAFWSVFIRGFTVCVKQTHTY